MHLTRRESQRIELISRGLSDKEMATALGVEYGTVKVGNAMLFKKLGVHRRYDAVQRVRELQSMDAVESDGLNACKAGAD